MSTLTEIGSFLQAAGVGTVGTNLFLGKMPASPVTAMAINLYPGRGPELNLGVEGVSIEFPRVQFSSRAADEVTAFANAETAYRVLSKVANKTIGGTFYSAINVLQSPGMLRRDQNDRPIVMFNFECEKALS